MKKIYDSVSHFPIWRHILAYFVTLRKIENISLIQEEKTSFSCLVYFVLIMADCSHLL